MRKASSSYPIEQQVSQFISQVLLLLWKRYREIRKSKWNIIRLVLPPLLFFTLLILLYEGFSFFNGGGVERFVVPLSFWVYIQRVVIQIMYEKSTRLQESMRMMGLSDLAYWTSYFISEGVLIGFTLSFLCSIMTVGGLFNHANFGTILGFLFCFCLSAVPFSFFICAFFDAPQSASQFTILLLIGFFVLDIVFMDSANRVNDFHTTQYIMCLFPPLALQEASGSFVKSYTGLPLSTICGMMVADIFIYISLAWYFWQVWPSKVGISKPFYFLLLPSYWLSEPYANQFTLRPLYNSGPDLGKVHVMNTNANDAVKGTPLLDIEETAAQGIKLDVEKGTVRSSGGNGFFETEDESILGQPTVVVNKLRKTFGKQVSVNNLSFKMYENQIFALLGHNGAGKTTTINLLTGMFRPDYTMGSRTYEQCDSFVYGSSVSSEMDQVRRSLGVCPQHDVLFEALNVEEHIMFFAQLKGASYEAAVNEASTLLHLFHLGNRMDHLGNELSGGQRRKLSVAIAVCGGSKFVVLDEPTAGMDPLARRELWDLLARLRKGRSMLLTTHYMDEADVLGDRVGIMSLGEMQCLGSTQFLKTSYGAGYKLIFDKVDGITSTHVSDLTRLIQSFIPEAVFIEEEGNTSQVLFSLPFSAVSKFGPLFTRIEAGGLDVFFVSSYGITIASLEEVFLKVGEDHTVTPHETNDDSVSYGIGADRVYQSDLASQTLGIFKRKLMIAYNDPAVTLPLIGIPIATAICAAILYDKKVISKYQIVNELVVTAMYMGGYIGAPGLVAEFIVKERSDRLRNVLTVMGCDFRAYWLGTFLADFALLCLPMVLTWITWPIANMEGFYSGLDGMAFFITILFAIQIICFSYFWSFIFTSPKSCVSFMPILIILLLICPNIVLIIISLIARATNSNVADSVWSSVYFWGTMIVSPHGALFTGLIRSASVDIATYVPDIPPVGATIAFMIFESIVFMGTAFYIDMQSIVSVTPVATVETVTNLDPDVEAERVRTEATTVSVSMPEATAVSVSVHVPVEAVVTDLDPKVAASESFHTVTPSLNNDPTMMMVPLKVSQLRKVFPPKQAGRAAVIANENVSFCVEKGEIFGLLGANGAGKTTTLSMLTRALIPTSGDAFVAGSSILSHFSSASKHLGVVTQNNSLWDRLSVEDHLYLFAKLRGVPEDLVNKVVDGTIDQLELRPHRKKLSMKLSGGMKRKLCVAIALIGDPDVVLLDEPSAGLDPVSRRNLWSVILRTMSQRAVILTTHSMDEAEALCKRIGIMVRGQLRALGTKQHLKVKFGSGFELSVKLKVHNLKEQIDALNKFIIELFPTSIILSENGGLVTIKIPKEEMRMGIAFSKLEENKQLLGIEDYSIIQPSLEQVFIRTVNQNADASDSNMTMNMSALDTSLALSPSTGSDSIPVFQEVNKCGLTSRFTKLCTGTSCCLAIIFLIVPIAAEMNDSSAGSAILSLLFFVSLFTAICGCSLLYCACCKPAVGSDE